MTLNERLALHYEKKALRFPDGAFGRMCIVWADKARNGHDNGFTRRVKNWGRNGKA